MKTILTIYREVGQECTEVMVEVKEGEAFGTVIDTEDPLFRYLERIELEDEELDQAERQIAQNHAAVRKVLSGEFRNLNLLERAA